MFRCLPLALLLLEIRHQYISYLLSLMPSPQSCGKSVVMAMHEHLVDLSLFATSPTNDWRFESVESPSHTTTEFYAPSYIDSRTQSRASQSQRHTGSQLPVDFDIPAPKTATFDFGFPSQRHTACERSFNDPPYRPSVRPLPRSYSLKPLPPLPSKKLCKPRPPRARTDFQSRCILQRLKKTRSEDPTTGRRDPLQQRRQMTTTPQLTLSVPHSTVRTGNLSPEMVWLPEDQMWLVTDYRHHAAHHSPPLYVAPASSHRQPSPSVYSDPTPPLTPDPSYPRNPLIDADGLSPIQSQFRSLIVDEERRSPLFQEAMQTIEDFDPMRSSQQYHGTDDDDGWPVDYEGWPIYDARMYESPIQSHPLPPMHFHLEEQEYEAEAEDPVSPESPHTPLSSFDEIEREWNSAVSVYSSASNGVGGDSSQQHSRDTSYQSYHSAASSLSFGKIEDPADFYPPKPLWQGVARNISAQTG